MRSSPKRFVGSFVTLSVFLAASLVGGLRLDGRSFSPRVYEDDPALVAAPLKTPRIALIWTRNSYGTGVMVNETLVLTATHVVCYPNKRPRPDVLVMGVPADVVASLDDTALLRLKHPVPFTKTFVGFTDPMEGEAVAVVWDEDSHSVVENTVMIHSTEITSRGVPFYGWLPHHGSSGSPVFQNGALIGVVSSHGFDNAGMLSPVKRLIEATADDED